MWINGGRCVESIYHRTWQLNTINTYQSKLNYSETATYLLKKPCSAFVFSRGIAELDLLREPGSRTYPVLCMRTRPALK